MNTLNLLKLVLTPFTALLLMAQPHPNFTGNWEIDHERCDYQPADETLVERILHDGPKLVITSVSRRPGHDEQRNTIRLTTDGEENLNIVAGREMTARTVWEDGKLVTHVRDKRGMQFFEVRSLSEDGKTQVVEGFMDPSRQRPMFRRVMTGSTSRSN